jgi:hypothetical protein
VSFGKEKFGGWLLRKLFENEDGAAAKGRPRGSQPKRQGARANGRDGGAVKCGRDQQRQRVGAATKGEIAGKEKKIERTEELRRDGERRKDRGGEGKKERREKAEWVGDGRRE